MILGDPGDANPGPGINAPVIDGGSLPGSAFFIANGVTNVTIKGFEMRNFTSNDNGIGNGISAWVGSTSNISIEDNYFHNLGYNGVLVGNDKSSNPAKWGDHTNWLIKNNILETFEAYGFELTNASNSSIENNIIHSNAVWNLASTCIMVDARRNESGIVIKGNQIDGQMWPGYPAVFVFANSFETPNVNLNDVLIEANGISTTGTVAQIYVYNNAGTGTVTGVTITNNNLSTLRTNTPALIDVTNNYWGSANGPQHAKNVFNMGSQGGTITVTGSGSVPTFCPWWKDISGTPGSYTGTSFAPITNNDVPTENYSNFTDAITGTTAGGTINVAAGVYTEQVYITKSLDLIGVGSKPVIKAPAAATRTTHIIPESGRTFDPIIFADGGAGVIDVTVDNFDIDGNNDGGSNTFCGILFRNTDPGTISNNDLHSLKGTGQETQGILMYGANTDVTVSSNTVKDFTRNGITANINSSAAISGNIVTGDGPLVYGNWAQNGIQIGYGASGSITGNTITGCSIQDPDWAASGILATQATGTTQINDNTITQNQVNIYLGDCSASIQGNTIYATTAGTGQTYCYGIVGDPGETKAPKPSPFGELNDASKSIRPGDNSNGTKTTLTVACANNIVESDGSGETGIGIYAGMYGTYDIDFTATGNTVRYWQYGFDLYEYPGSNLVSAEIHYNDIEGNGYGVYNELTKIFDATNNWWGSNDGPEDTTGADEAALTYCPSDVSTMKNKVADISGTLGNAVTDYVDYCPWLGVSGFDAETYAGCNHPCDDFCLDFKLSGTDIRFFHFEYQLPSCIHLVSGVCRQAIWTRTYCKLRRTLPDGNCFSI